MSDKIKGSEIMIMPVINLDGGGMYINLGLIRKIVKSINDCGIDINAMDFLDVVVGKKKIKLEDC